MFEDVFEPLDDIIGGDAQEASDEWGDVWDTGDKEDMWRADPKDVWSIAPGNQPIQPGPAVPAPDKTPQAPDDQCGECDTECEKEKCEAPCDQGGSGLFDDIFLNI